MGLSPDEIMAISDLNAGFRTKAVTLYQVATSEYCPACEWDPIGRASAVLDCQTCKGYGKVVTYVAQTKLVRPDWQRVEWQQADSGEIEMAGVVLHVGAADVADFKKVRDTEAAYLLLDGFTLKPLPIMPTFIGDEFLVGCQAFNVERFWRERPA